jgi:hypothetical protein
VCGIHRGACQSWDRPLQFLRGKAAIQSSAYSNQTARQTITAARSYEWWAAMLYEMLVPQPVTYTAQASERAVASMLDMRSPDHPMRRMSVPADFVFFSRLNLSMNAILSALGATVYARAMVDDMDGIAAPVTELGRRHDAWVRQRGLPHGMDEYAVN